MGMDRAIKKKRWTTKRLVWLTVLTAAAAGLAWATYNVGSTNTYRMERDYATVATVSSGEFRDYTALRATVEPAQSMYIDILQGGTVEEIYVEDGAIVKRGDPLVKFANPDFELNILKQEGSISEQINRNSEIRLQLDQNLRNLKNQLTDIDYQLKSKRRELERKEVLLSKKHISQDAIDRIKDDIEYQMQRRQRTLQDIADEESLYPAKIKQVNENDLRYQRHLEIVRNSLDNLTVRAPIDGQLIDMEVSLGERKSQGTSLGRIDNIEQFKLMAEVDEYYINRVKAGQAANFRFNDNEHQARVGKVYPQIKNGRFEVKLTLDGSHPEGLRRGLSLQLQLELGAASESLLLANGSFYNDTGGNWAFVLNETGDVATKRDIRLGRRNNDVMEVRSGLRPGERVIISSYAGLEDYDKIILSN